MQVPENESKIYPRWIYHRDLPKGKIVYNAQEEFESGEGWVDSPANIKYTSLPKRKGR